RFEGGNAGWNGSRESGRAAPRPVEPPRPVRAGADDQADDVRAGPGDRSCGHAAGPLDRARGGQERLPVLLAGGGDCIERCIPHAGTGGMKAMHLTRKHLSRRTVLRGAGVAVGLPLLDAMIPAATALAKTDAAPKLRAGFFYMPHGAVMGNTKHGKAMDRWTP